MATYIVWNEHRAEECETLSDEVAANPLPRSLDGTEFLCTCPSGTHAGFFSVTAAGESDVLALLPPKFRAGAHVYAGEVMTIGREIPVA